MNKRKMSTITAVPSHNARIWVFSHTARFWSFFVFGSFSTVIESSAVALADPPDPLTLHFLFAAFTDVGTDREPEDELGIAVAINAKAAMPRRIAPATSVASVLFPRRMNDPDVERRRRREAGDVTRRRHDMLGRPQTVADVDRNNMAGLGRGLICGRPR
jgi:hypothetical protein